MLRKIKDATLSKGVKIAINNQIKEYGRMLKLNLDSKEKTIEIEVLLDGECEPLKVRIGDYKMIEEDGRYTMQVHDVSTSRAWINTIASSHLEGKSFEIPAEYAKMLKVVI